MAQDKLISFEVRELLIFEPLLGLPCGVSTPASASQLSTLRGRGGLVLPGPGILGALVTCHSPSLGVCHSPPHTRFTSMGWQLRKNLRPVTVTFTFIGSGKAPLLEAVSRGSTRPLDFRVK